MYKLKQKVQTLLNIPHHLGNYWQILDSYANRFYLIGTVDNERQPIDFSKQDHLEHLRDLQGIVYDAKTNRFVLPAWKHQVKYQVDSPLEENEFHYSFHAKMINTQKPCVNDLMFDKEKTQFFVGYEGPIIRIWKWEGQIFVSTLKKIQWKNSILPSSNKTFIDAYKELNGVDVNTIFGEDDSSPYIINFQMCHRDVNYLSSRQEHCLIYAGIQIRSGFTGTIDPFIFENTYNTRVSQPISIDQVNKILFPKQNVFFVDSLMEGETNLIFDDTDNLVDVECNPNPSDDLRLDGGSYIILYDSTTATFIQLMPPSYLYRRQMLNRTINLYHKFFTEMATYCQKSEKEYETDEPAVYWDGKVLPTTSQKQKMEYWWTLFFYCVSPHHRKEVITFMDRLHDDLSVINTQFKHEDEANILLYKKGQDLFNILRTLKK